MQTQVKKQRDRRLRMAPDAAAPAPKSLASEITAHRSKLQWPRRIFHLVNGLLIAFTYLLTGLEPFHATVIMGCITLLAVGADFLRLHWPAFNEKCIKDFMPLMRDYETKHLASSSYFVMGAFLAVLLFPKPIAVVAIIYLAVGDPISSIVGILFGDIKLVGKKSLEGSLACFNLCFLAGAALLVAMGMPLYLVPMVALFGAFGAAVAEVLPLELDDNLRLPLLGGLVLWLSALLLGISNLGPGVGGLL